MPINVYVNCMWLPYLYSIEAGTDQGGGGVLGIVALPPPLSQENVGVSVGMWQASQLCHPPLVKKVRSSLQLTTQSHWTTCLEVDRRKLDPSCCLSHSDGCFVWAWLWKRSVAKNFSHALCTYFLISTPPPLLRIMDQPLRGTTWSLVPQ